MNYYSETDIPTNEYIEKYKIKGDIITCYLANGEKYIIPNTTENIATIHDRMLMQAKRIYAREKSIKMNINTCLLAGIIGLIFICIGLTLAIHKSITTATFDGAIIWLISSFVLPISFIKYSVNKSRELKKLALFLHEEETLNREVAKDINNLNRISKKTKDRIISKEEEIFDISLVDKMSLKDLKTIKENIERNNNFNFKDKFNIKQKKKN